MCNNDIVIAAFELTASIFMRLGVLYSSRSLYTICIIKIEIRLFYTNNIIIIITASSFINFRSSRMPNSVFGIVFTFGISYEGQRNECKECLSRCVLQFVVHGVCAPDPKTRREKSQNWWWRVRMAAQYQWWVDDGDKVMVNGDMLCACVYLI